MEKDVWFKAKRYGYGWYPVTWQGWGITALYLFALIPDFIAIDRLSHSASDTLIAFLPRFIVLTIFLIIICDARGEPARWRWGK